MTPIHHTFAPMADAAFCVESLGLLLRPWRWKRGPAVHSLRATLAAMFGKDAFLFASGREALLAGLKALPLTPGDEVIVQGYTCVVVPNAIHAAGGKTVYADIDPDTLNLTVETVSAVLTPKTRVIICQHTFGIPTELSGLRALCNAKGIVLIEDCAHVMPDSKGPRGIGTTGDLALFSFGRDKAVSGIAGGAILAKGETAKRLKQLETSATDLSPLLIARYLLYPLLYAAAKPLYNIVVGKALLVLAAKTGLLVPIVEGEEKQGRMKNTLHRMPGACAALALSQIRRLGEINDHRRALTALYLHKKNLPAIAGAMEGLPLQKFPLFVPDADAVRTKLKAQNIHLDDGWTSCVICPRVADAAASGYQPGSDRCAEEVAAGILSLPTHPTMTPAQARRLLDILSKTLG